MTRVCVRMVPWTGMEEWRYVAKAVYVHDTCAHSLEEAVKYLQVWCIRGNVPPAVETTYSLLSIKKALRDYIDGEKSRMDENGFLSPKEDADIYGGNAYTHRSIRLALAMAIVRFVNEVVDPEQQGQYAKPVSYLAERMSIPRILVDIRHAATHDELPELEYLLMGLEMTLNWLKEHYWQVQMDYELGVREATLKMLDRFMENAKQCDSLVRPVETLAMKCITDVTNVEVSPDVQRPFLLSLIESSFPVEKLLPIVGAVTIKDESFASLILDTVLNFNFINRDRIQTILVHAIRLVASEAAVAKCVKLLLLSHDQKTSKFLLQLVAANLQIQISDELTSIIDLKLRPIEKAELSHNIIDSLKKRVKEMHERFNLQSDNDDASNDDKDKDAMYWHVPKGWRPMPFGQTPTFDSAKQFRELFTK